MCAGNVQHVQKKRHISTYTAISLRREVILQSLHYKISQLYVTIASDTDAALTEVDVGLITLTTMLQFYTFCDETQCTLLRVEKVR